VFNEDTKTDTTMGRSTTPPPLSYLLTPPPTGGLDRGYGFADARPANVFSKRLNTVKEGESPTSFFGDPAEASDTQLANLSEAEPLPALTDTAPASPVSDVSTAFKTSIADTHNLLAPPSTYVLTPAPTEPFPFLLLPLSIRKKVYQHLLVIPALLVIRQTQTSPPSTSTPSSDRTLLPGIACAVAYLAVNSSAIPFSCFVHANIFILLASKEIHAEARSILYGLNTFAIPKPSTELSPPTDFSVRLFPPGCQRLVRTLHMQLRSFYDLAWLTGGRHNDVKIFYRGVGTLTLVLELDSVAKGFGKQWARRSGEAWEVYVQRLQGEMALDVRAGSKVERKAEAKGKERKIKVVPAWIQLRVLFGGEMYDEKLEGAGTTAVEQAKRDELRHALTEAWELFKKGSP
jgi:hypothetical protein